jgi:hypothetical protein
VRDCGAQRELPAPGIVSPPIDEFAATTSCICSSTRGSGPRLFPEEAAPAKLSLAASESYDNGVVYLAYRPQA